MKRRAKGKSKNGQLWMLVREGFVQRTMFDINGRHVKGWPVAETHADAVRLARWMPPQSGPPGTAWDMGIRPSRIGDVEGETLEGHISLALDEGCELVACVAGWNEDGAPVWKYLPFD